MLAVAEEDCFVFVDHQNEHVHGTLAVLDVRMLGDMSFVDVARSIENAGPLECSRNQNVLA